MIISVISSEYWLSTMVVDAIAFLVAFPVYCSFLMRTAWRRHRIHRLFTEEFKGCGGWLKKNQFGTSIEVAVEGGAWADCHYRLFQGGVLIVECTITWGTACPAYREMGTLRLGLRTPGNPIGIIRQPDRWSARLDSILKEVEEWVGNYS